MTMHTTPGYDQRANRRSDAAQWRASNTSKEQPRTGAATGGELDWEEDWEKITRRITEKVGEADLSGANEEKQCKATSPGDGGAWLEEVNNAPAADNDKEEGQRIFFKNEHTPNGC